MRLQTSIVLITFIAVILYQLPMPKKNLSQLLNIKNFFSWNRMEMPLNPSKASNITKVQLPFFTIEEEKILSTSFIKNPQLIS